MAYDPLRGRTVLFGGYGPTYPDGSDFNDTWEYDGSNWVQVSPSQSPVPLQQVPLAYDTRRARLVLVGNSQTWEYVGPCPQGEAPREGTVDAPD